ncbi:hypothetical protein C0416_01145 [bacterium]|nr:hypothetical protein [bacterium]
MFYLLRHGETNFNAEGLIQGHSDKSVLNDKGKMQIENAGRLLAEKVEYFDEVYCSDILRAKESWEILKEHIRYIRVSFDSVLREQFQGCFEGLPYTDSNWLLNKSCVAESELDVESRMADFFKNLDSEKEILIISHGHALKLFLSSIGVGIEKIPNGAIIKMNWNLNENESPVFEILTS